MRPASPGLQFSGRAAALQLTLLLLLALVVLLPLLWLVSTSLKGPAENIFTSPPALLPSQPSLAAYGQLFAANPMLTYLRNSALVSALAVLANLLFCSLAAYPLARLRFRGRGLVLALVVATILIPFQVVIFELLFRTNARTDVVTAPAPLIVRLLLTVTTPLLPLTL